MLKSRILATQELGYRVSFTFLLLEKLWGWLRALKILPKKLFPIDYYLQAAKIPDPQVNSKTDNKVSLELLFVSTQKDFLILPHSVKYALRNCGNYSKLHATIIVPDSDLSAANQIFGGDASIHVIAETEVLGDKIIESIKPKFGWRAGWVIQQLLKFEYSSTAATDGVLIIDSDTLLIQPRTWLTSDGKQVLTPTWERNVSYYKFLHELGVCSENVDFSFVPHHMLIQPRYLREAREKFSVLELQSMVSAILNFSGGDEVSPFCIDFEFYAQYMFKYHPNLIRLEKWSNVGVKRLDMQIDQQLNEVVNNAEKRFASISFHSYL